MAVIAIDLGGTKLAGAVVRADGKIVYRNVLPLERRAGNEVGALIRGKINFLLDLAASRRIRISAIGVGVPGIVDPKSGNIWAPNIRGWESYPLRSELERELRKPRPRRSRQGLPRLSPTRIEIESDRACYIVGETWRGASKGCQNAIFVAVGTGIGVGILADGRVLRGTDGIAGAAGWLALDRPFRREYLKCGCFEFNASGEGLARFARDLLHGNSEDAKASLLGASKDFSSREIFAAYEWRDPIARAVLSQAIQYWGMATANLISLFNPEKVIFGGGVFGPARRFIPEIRARAKKWAQPISMKRVKIEASKLGADAGLYGAAYLALNVRQQ
jgi:glucokinase